MLYCLEGNWLIKGLGCPSTVCTVFHNVCCYFFHLMLLYDGIKDFPLIVYFSGKMTISAKLCFFNFPFLAFYESCLFAVFQFCNNGSGTFIGAVYQVCEHDGYVVCNIWGILSWECILSGASTSSDVLFVRYAREYQVVMHTPCLNAQQGFFNVLFFLFSEYPFV